MDVPAAVLGVVLLELAVGAVVLLWLAPTWGAVRHGYEALVSATVALVAWAAWAALRSPLATAAAEVPAARDAATWVGRTGALLAILAGASAVLVLTRAAVLGRVVGIAAAAVGVAGLVPVALLRDQVAVGSAAWGLLGLVCGALLLGAAWDGLLLGHWYLVQRRLSPRYMRWMARANVAGAVAGTASVLLSVRDPVPCAGLTGAALERCALTFSPLLSVGSTTLWIGLGVMVLVGAVAAVNLRLSAEGGRSIQAATGMAYLAVILAPAAEFAAKVRFF